LTEFTYPNSYPIEKSSYDPTTLKLTTDKPVGVGPFVITNHTPNQEMDFAPNPNWYGPKTKLTQVKMPFFQDQETAYKSYESGAVQLAQVTSQHLPGDKSKPDFHAVPSLWTDGIYVNFAKPPFDNQKVRLAFAEAIDINTIANVILRGLVVPTHQWIPPGMPGWFQDFETNPVWKFDPAQAKKDLADAGFPGGQGLPPITLAYSNAGPDFVKEFTAIQSMWKSNLGVSVALNQLTFNQILTQDDNGSPATDQLFALAWIADYPDPHDWTTLLWHSGVAYNTTGFNSPQFDSLVDKADLEPDKTKRLQMVHDAEKILEQQVAIIETDNVVYEYRLSPKVHGFIINAQQLVLPDVWSNVYITQ
jgi:peptide/nickel transport system substrate-binding protein/oligopeptide transport system substrate-binding protein